jgi:hypothetical protein
MGMLALIGAEIAIGIVIGLILTVVGLFFGNISLFESIATGIIVGVAVHKIGSVHPGIAVGIGIITLIILYFLQTTSVGFWIVGGLYSVAWGFIVCLVVFSASGKNMAYTYIGWAIGALAFLGLHLIAKGRKVA